MKKIIYFLLAIVVITSLALVGPTAAKTSKPFFKGKTIKMLVPFGPGGGLDVWNRIIASFWGKHIPGNPTIIVVSKPGAGGGKAFNILYRRAKSDGLTVVSGTPGTVARWLTKKRGHTTYDLNKMGLLAISPSGTIHYVSTRLGVSSVEKLISLGKTIKGGFTDTGSNIAVVDRMAADLLGYSTKQISGYKGYGEATLGMLRGETDMSGLNANGYFGTVIPLVKNGEAAVLFQSGIFDPAGNIVRDPRIPDVPTVEEIYKKIYRKAPEGGVWKGLKAVISAQTIGFSLWLAPGVSQERTQVLETALKSMVDSSEFKVEAEKLLGGKAVFFIGDKAQVPFQTYANTPPDIIDLFRKKRK